MTQAVTGGLTQARAFCRGPDFRSAKDTTADTGVQGLLPAAAIDDFVFEPCGYSMNALEGPLMSSIHVTPEEGWSYASFELCGPSLPDLLTTVQQVWPSGLTAGCARRQHRVHTLHA